MKKIIFASLLFLSACSTPQNPEIIRPETLVNSTAERISFPVTDASSVANIDNWLKGDMPSKAEISCNDGNPACAEVHNLLMNSGIPTDMVTDANGGNTLSLVYNRVVARECKSGLGCSVSLNSLRMVTNREQFTNPALSDFQDANSAVKAIGEYAR